MPIPPHHLPAMRALIGGRLDEAERLIGGLLAADANDAHAHMLAARLAAARRDFVREYASIEEVIALDPLNGEYRAMLARCFARQNDLARALAAIDAALARAPLSDVAIASIGSTYSHFGRHADAARLLGGAVDRGSRNPALYFNLGNYLKFTGDFAGARQAFEAALALAPDYHKAHASLSALQDAPLDAAGLAKIEALRRETRDPKVAIHLCHALSKQYEAGGRYDDSWNVLTEGKAALKAVVGRDADRMLAAAEALRVMAFDPGPAKPAGKGAPLFIVGMPRSGTTVLDRMISNHEEVDSIGETLYFAQLLKIASGSAGNEPLDPSMIALLGDRDALRAMGDAYRGYCEERCGKGRRVLNKFHMHFLHAGHLMAALPDARILCMIRHPLDTVMSNYRQLFEFDTPTYCWSLDVMDTARFYVEFRRLALHWQGAAPDRFRCVDYEALVRDPEAVAPDLFDFCGLDWDPRYVRIEDNRASVATASAVQVRQPVHSGNIGRWRDYSDRLDPVRGLVGAYLA